MKLGFRIGKILPNVNQKYEKCNPKSVELRNASIECKFQKQTTSNLFNIHYTYSNQ
jgi:hypothetical protein